MVDEGSLRKVEVPDGPNRFDFSLKNHYHVRCAKCGEVSDVDMDEIPDLLKQLRKKDSLSLQQNFRAVGEIEKHHEERYRALLKNIETAKVFEKSEVKVWECRNCGHIVVGTKAPEVCPVCNHPKSYFEVHEENY